MTTATEYVDAAAADFGRHTAGGGGWALGLEVASCVKPGTGEGRPPRNRRDHDSSKVSARTFATKAGTSPDRVLRIHEAWERAAAKGLVPYAEDLAPEDWDVVENIPKNVDWSDFYNAASGAGRNISNAARRDALIAAAEKAGVGVSKVLDVASNPKAVQVAIAADPSLAKSVADSKAGAAVSREVLKQHGEEGDRLRKKRDRLRREQLERDMEEGHDPDDNLVTHMEDAASNLSFAFQLGSMARDLKEIVKRLKRNGLNLTERDEIRLHGPKIRAALDDLEVLAETEDLDNEAEQLLGDT